MQAQPSLLSSFLESLADYWQNLSVSSVIMTVIVFFMVVGLVDKLRGNKLGYGEKFDEGFAAMGPLAVAVVGIVSLSPVLLSLLQPVLTPVYGWLGASPAMFPSTFLALDMGGYVLAKQLAGGDVAVGLYSGIIVASMMGVTMSFSIPYALSAMKKEDHPLLAKGVLVGIVTMPLGCLAGGLLMGVVGMPLSFGALLGNTLPVLLISLAIALGLLFAQKLTLKLFVGFGKVLTFIITVSPVLAAAQYLTGLRLPLFDKMVLEDPALGGVPLEKGLLLVGLIAIVLLGAFPMVHFLNKRLSGVLSRHSQKTGMNSVASSALLTQMANSIPIWSLMDQMNERGKLMNIAFAVSGSFVLGDVLAFTGGAAPAMVFPVIVAKLVGGFSAMALVGLLFPVQEKAGSAQAAL